MELFLLKLVAFVRPLASLQYGEAFFVIIGVGLFAILVGAVLMRAAMQKSLILSQIDALILAFTVWAIAVFLIYYDRPIDNISELPKALIPLISYTIAKNVFPDREEYRRVLLLIIAGFSVPMLLSAGLIMAGRTEAVEMEMYFTGLLRWRGAYEGAHSLGHSMTLFLMTLVVYASLRDTLEGDRHRRHWQVEKMVLAFLGVGALYCLYMSQVRSAVLGLLVFVGIYGYLQNKKALLLGGAALAAVAVVTAPFWIPALLHEFAPDRRGGELEFEQMGSGRIVRWKNDISVYTQLPIDQQLAGVGFGTKTTDLGALGGHNDWLMVLTRSGLIGFGLFLTLQILILRRTLRMHGRERNLFLAMFGAVCIMMAVSNSYLFRIQVSHLYYIILAFIEIPNRRSITEQKIS